MTETTAPAIMDAAVQEALSALGHQPRIGGNLANAWWLLKQTFAHQENNDCTTPPDAVETGWVKIHLTQGVSEIPTYSTEDQQGVWVDRQTLESLFLILDRAHNQWSGHAFDRHEGPLFEQKHLEAHVYRGDVAMAKEIREKLLTD